MTLEPYTPDQLDQMALRVLDVCLRLRTMAHKSRSEEFERLPLHVKKALEWLGNLEQWAHKGESELDVAIARNRGARRARQVPPGRARQGRRS